MIRNTSTVIIFTLFLSACCEKEGSFLNTVIKNHAVKVAAAAKQQTIISQESSTLNANAAAITIDTTVESHLKKPNTKNTANQTIVPENQVEIIEPLESTAEPVIENAGEIVDQLTSDSPTTKATQNGQDQTLVTAANQIEQSSDNTTIEAPTPEDNKAKKLSELLSLLNEEDNTAIEKIIERTKTEELTPKNESEFDKNQQLLELLSKDIKQQAGQSDSEISQKPLELPNDILSD